MSWSRFSRILGLGSFLHKATVFRAPEDANLSSQLLGKKGYGYTPPNRPTSAGVSAESGRFSSAPSASSTSLLDASARQFPGLRSRMVPSSHTHRRSEASAGASADVGQRLSAASSTFSTSCSCCGRGSLGLFAGQVLYSGAALDIWESGYLGVYFRGHHLTPLLVSFQV